MRKLIAALLTAASLTTPALAQDRDPGGGGMQAAPERDWHRNDDNRGEHRRDQARPAPAPQQAPQAQTPQAVQQRQEWQGRRDGAQGQGQGRPGWNGQRGQNVQPGTAQPGFQGQMYDRRRQQLDEMRGQAQRQRQFQDNRRDYRDDRRDGRNEGRDWHQGGQQPGRGDRELGRWNQGWRHDQRYDWQRYRFQNRSAFHLPRYYAPRGWGFGYQRFGLGAYLSGPLFGESYWIDDPFDYRLPPAYGPYHWVRYYNDVMLVDVRTGYVVDAIYDFFL